MCGIAGIIKNRAEKTIEQRVLQMTRSLNHRGPDALGIYDFGDAVLGHARLSIVDLTTGAQPMLTPNNKVGITFNGEIYGYREIKKQIDYNYQTTSDTELLLALYKKYGTEMFAHLPGAFSFAIWDDDSKKLTCGRDRFGEKPFYYAWGENKEFIFASEIKAIIASGLIQPKLNKQALAHYLERFYVKPNETIYANIHTLPPAHCLTLTNQSLTIKRYWKFPPIKEKIDFHQAVEKFRYLFHQSVQKQLVADVPVAAFLSGGLDSTSVVTAASNINRQLKLLSFRFDKQTDESPIANETAKHLGLDIQTIEAKNYKPADLLIEMVNVYDEPFADSSNMPTYLISKYASQYAKVALTGDGGDELLGGYEYWYKPLLNFDKIKNYKGNKNNLFFAAKLLWKIGLRSKASKYFTLYDSLKRFKGIQDLKQAHYQQTKFFTATEINALMKTHDYNSDMQKYDTCQRGDLSDAMQMDLLDFMPGDILVKTDRASMANSLELRAPFLDVKLAEFCISLPHTLKINSDESKILLRRAYEDQWTSNVRIARKKGFESPLGKWMGQAEMHVLVKEFLEKKHRKIYNYLDYRETIGQIKKDSNKMFGLLTLSLWMEKHTFDA